MEAMAIRKGGALVDQSHLLSLEIMGRDSVGILSHMTGLDRDLFESLPVLGIVNAFLLNTQGFVLGSALIARSDVVSWQVLTDLSDGSALIKTMEAMIAQNPQASVVWMPLFETWARFRMIGGAGASLLAQILTRGEETVLPLGYLSVWLRAIPARLLCQTLKNESVVDLLIPSGYAKSFWNEMTGDKAPVPLWPLGLQGLRAWQIKSHILPEDLWRHHFTPEHLFWQNTATAKEWRYLGFLTLTPSKPMKNLPSLEIETIDRRKIGQVLEWVVDPITQVLTGIALCPLEAGLRDMYVRINSKQDLHKVSLSKMAFLPPVGQHTAPVGQYHEGDSYV
jgi:hypothetical protein